MPRQRTPSGISSHDSAMETLRHHGYRRVRRVPQQMERFLRLPRR